MSKHEARDTEHPQIGQSRPPRQQRSQSPPQQQPRSYKRQRSYSTQGPPGQDRPGRSCANCRRTGHATCECVGPVTALGMLQDVCVECGIRGHVYNSRCPRWDERTAARKLVWFRQNKPEVQTSINLADLLQGRVDQGDKFWLNAKNFSLPWSGTFAWEYQQREQERNGPGFWRRYKYIYRMRPDLECGTREVDPRRGLCENVQDAISRLRATGNGSRNDAGTNAALPPKCVPDHSRLGNIPPSHSGSEGCLNCADNRHTAIECPLKCRACGSTSHNYNGCPNKSKACICHRYARHIIDACDIRCSLCGPDVREHTAVSCTAHCQYCWQPGHAALVCPAIPIRFGYCPRNCGDRHLQQSCGAARCPDRKCATHVGCEAHCLRCGYQAELDLVRLENGGAAHECQWARKGDPMKPGMGIFLECTGCKSRAYAHTLAAIRSSAVAKWVSGFEEWRATRDRGKDPGQNPWMIGRPECKTCFMSKHPDGDYDMQAIGAGYIGMPKKG